MIGEVIAGRYELTKVLGEGGMGAVYEANQLKLNREVAVKLMHGQITNNDEAKLRFIREAKVSGALHHPNAVKIFDFGEDEQGRLYLVMEKLRGTTLRTFVGRDIEPMPLGRSVEISRQLAEVLVAAHGISLTHRDLKPENIFLEVATDGGDRVVVVDFGLAFIDEREDANRMTQEGQIMGTPYYMSPEQCKGKGIGPASDIYAFGCMLYEMVTGVVPFDGPGVVLLTKHCFEDPIRPGHRRKDLYVPRTLERLILAMMLKQPAGRPSASDVLAVLHQLSHTLGERERTRGTSLLEGREARMIPTVRTTAEQEALESGFDAPRLTHPELQAAPDDARVLPVVGPALERELDLGLRANGFAPWPVQQPPMPDGAVAIFAPEATEALVTELVDFGLPVITDAGSDEMDRVSAMLAAGAADVVTRPVRPEKLVKKLGRAIKKHRRRAGR